MPWPAIENVRKWGGKHKGLLMGLVGVAVEETINLVSRWQPERPCAFLCART